MIALHLMPLSLILLIVIVILLIVLAFANRHHGGTDYTQTKGDRSWRKDNPDGSFTIYDKHGAGTIVKTYEGGERYIDGHRVNCADDMARWYVKKGFGEGLERRIGEIECEPEKLNSDGGNELLTEWDERYATYRKLCMEIGMWNWVIGDHATFVPTAAQLEMEQKRREAVVDLYHKWQERLTDNRVVLDYLEKCPRKHCHKKVLIKELSENDPEREKHVQSIYRRLLKSEIIGEKKTDNDEIETRIIIRRNQQVKRLPTLPASTYHAEIYANVCIKDIYKVDYTVSAPEKLDREKNVCFFTSKTSGERYATSLERCTCPSFCKGYACKHMLALAIYLGYYDRSSAKR